LNAPAESLPPHYGGQNGQRVEKHSLDLMSDMIFHTDVTDIDAVVERP